MGYVHVQDILKSGSQLGCYMYIWNEKEVHFTHAESVIFGDHVNGMDIRRGLRNRCEYSHQTWIFRILLSPSKVQSAWSTAPLARCLISIVAHKGLNEWRKIELINVFRKTYIFLLSSWDIIFCHYQNIMIWYNPSATCCFTRGPVIKICFYLFTFCVLLMCNRWMSA